MRPHDGSLAAAPLDRDAWSVGRVPAVLLTPREKALVALLAAGHSEESAAAELGVSRRTVLYALRAMMDRVGVHNRFQLALILGASHAVALPRTDEQEDPPPDG
jgi:DNA-binding CsgD family transcriptional regulator